MIRHHPSVGKIDTVFELDRDHLRVHLDDNTFQPITDALIVFIVIAKHFDLIADMILLIQVWCMSEIHFCQSTLPDNCSFHLIYDSLLKSFPDPIERDTLHDRIKEPLHNQMLSFGVWYTPT